MSERTFLILKRDNDASIVTRLGDFWKFLVIFFLSKVAQMSGDFLSSFQTQHLASSRN